MPFNTDNAPACCLTARRFGPDENLDTRILQFFHGKPERDLFIQG